MAVSGAKGKRALVASVAPRWHFCYRSLPKPLICRVSSAVEQRFCNSVAAVSVRHDLFNTTLFRLIISP